VTDWGSRLTSYTYDAAGRQTVIAYPNGVSSTNTYDNADRLISIAVIKGAATLESFSYTLDNAGNRLTMVDADGTTSYSYDALNRLAIVVYPSDSPANVSYSYDPMGNRLSMIQDGVVTSYTYDDADRLLAYATTGITTTLTWDANGNQLSKGSQTFGWDHSNRLVSLTNGTNNASYTYNGDGARISRTVDGTRSDYLLDLAGGLPVVLRETNDGNQIDFVYGNDLL